MWGPGLPFRDFTYLELNEEDLASEERPPSNISSALKVCWTLTVFSCGDGQATEKIKSRQCTISRQI